MPTHTPSPHRFLAPSGPSSQKPKPKPSSTLRHGFTAQTPKPATRVPEDSALPPRKVTPAKRFVVNPHRSTLSTEEHASSKQMPDEARGSGDVQLTPHLRPKRQFERVESIEEPQSSPSATLQDGHGSGIAQTIEDEPASIDPSDHHHHDSNDDDEEMLFDHNDSNKRRRLSTPISPTLTHPSEPTTLITRHNTSTHRFLVPPPRTPGVSIAQSSTQAPDPVPPPSVGHRPHFILPPQPTSPQKPIRPIPEIFSPSRKNGRFTPNGLASTVQGWIIETANSGSAAKDRGSVPWGRDKEDGVKLKLRVSGLATGGSNQGVGNEVECFPNSFVLVRGDTQHGLYNVSRAPDIVEDGELRILLAGHGGARSTAGVKVRVGSVLGIRTPMWDVEISGTKWLMSVDWIVL